MVLVCAVLACGDARGPEGTPGSAAIDTVGGVVYVRNEGRGLWRPGEAWSLEIDLRIGSFDDADEAQFASVLVAVVPGANGHILVLDHMAAHIQEFDADGRLVGHFGRRGDGPGEFVGPGGVAVDDSGRVWVADVFPSLYSTFAPDGDFEASYRRPVQYAQRRVHQLFLRSDGRIIDYASRGSTTHGDVIFMAAEPETEMADTIASAPLPVRITGPSTPGPSRPAMSSVSSHLLPGFVWTWSPVDESFWVAWTDGERLVNLSPTGDTLRVIEVAHRPRPLTDQEEEVVAEALRETGRARGEMNIVPNVVKALRVTDDGHLLVFVADDDIDLEAAFGAATLMEVYDPAGRFLGTVDLGFFPDCSFVLLDQPSAMGMRVLPEGMRRDTIRLALFSAGGSLERILLHHETPDYWFRNRGGSWARVRPIFGEEVAAFVRGDELWVGRTGELGWSRIAQDGTDRGRAALEFVPRSASDAQIDRERARRVDAVRTWGGRTPTGPNDVIGITADNERQSIREVGVRRTIPEYDMVVVGLDRSLWIRRFPAPEETTATWLLLDSALVSVGSTTMSRDDVVIAGSLDVAVVKSVDSIGVPVVRLVRRR